ncbi:hypothetical protein KIPB_011833, partial [Kipferlia bialata]|eukprot:g11833.t1
MSVLSPSQHMSGSSGPSDSEALWQSYVLIDPEDQSHSEFSIQGETLKFSGGSGDSSRKARSFHCPNVSSVDNATGMISAISNASVTPLFRGHSSTVLGLGA